MRDILVILIVFIGCVAALRRPWIGIMLWTWLSIMNPHRYTYGIAYDAPLAAVAAVCVLVGLLMTTERESPFKGSPVTWLVVFMLWMTVSWLFGLDVGGDYAQWKKVMKIDAMLLIGLVLLRTKQHVLALMIVCVGSLALLGVKGGVFTLFGSAVDRIYGPPDSFISDNNAFALSLVLVIPLLRFLQLQMQKQLSKLVLALTMLLCALSALASYSRGALLAVIAMAITLWWRSKDKVRIGALLVLAAVLILAFMPNQWYARMASIETYQDDTSAMGRIGAWWMAWNSAWHYPTGVGFETARPELFAKFSPYPDVILAAHSIYFQILGNHGFVGFVLFLGIWFTTWRSADWLRKQNSLSPSVKWTVDLGSMCQVALIGYLIGGAFLSLAYFDLPYDIMVIVVLTRVWVEKKAWQTEPTALPKWMTLLGFA